MVEVRGDGSGMGRACLLGGLVQLLQVSTISEGPEALGDKGIRRLSGVGGLRLENDGVKDDE